MNPVTPEEYIAGIPMWTRNKNTISGIRKFLEALHVSEKNIIHVAGTNGKGSVCAYLTAILNASGYSTGTFVSPHLTDVKERFLMDGEPVSEDDLGAAFDRVLSVVRDICGERLFHPSYFEFCFLIAMTLFTVKDVDFRILETGLGGRLDATNAVKKPIACVITSISRDHTRYLGDTIEEIASEKAGIIKPYVPVIYDASDPEAARVIAGRAQSLNAPAFPVLREDIRNADGRSAAADIPHMPETEPDDKIPQLTAPYQKLNAALALETLKVLRPERVTCGTVYKGLSSARWPGRMEEIRDGIWLDGAHNPGGTAAFIEAVRAREDADGPFRVHLLFAVAEDKDYRSMISLLSEGLSPAAVTVTAFEGERAADAGELAGLFMAEGCHNVKAVSDPYEALSYALAGLKSKDDRLYITGSLYLIGALRPRLLRPGAGK